MISTVVVQIGSQRPSVPPSNPQEEEELVNRFAQKLPQENAENLSNYPCQFVTYCAFLIIPYFLYQVLYMIFPIDPATTLSNYTYIAKSSHF